MLCSSHCISYDQFALKFGLAYYGDDLFIIKQYYYKRYIGHWE